MFERVVDVGGPMSVPMEVVGCGDHVDMGSVSV